MMLQAAGNRNRRRPGTRMRPRFMHGHVVRCTLVTRDVGAQGIGD